MKIGETFAAELRDSGVDFGVTWDGDGLLFADALTEDQRKKVQAVLDAHDPIPTLTQARWNFLLDVTDARDVLNGVLDAMPKDTFEEKVAWAAMKATALDAQTFHWDRTIALVEGIRATGIKGIPSEKELFAAWMLASKFEGVS